MPLKAGAYVAWLSECVEPSRLKVEVAFETMVMPATVQFEADA